MVALDTFNVESMVTAPPTERALFNEASFWTSKVDARMVAFYTFNVDKRAVPKSTSNVESMVTAPPTERALFNEASF